MEVDLKKKTYSFTENYHDQLFYDFDYIKESLAVCREETTAAIEKLHRMDTLCFRLDKALELNFKEQKEVLMLIVALGQGLRFLKETENNIKKSINDNESH